MKNTRQEYSSLPGTQQRIAWWQPSQPVRLMRYSARSDSQFQEPPETATRGVHRATGRSSGRWPGAFAIGAGNTDPVSI